MIAKKLFFMDCHLAGRKYHDADEVWDDLKVGTVLKLERDKENRHDVNAVAVVYEKEGEEYKIGYIPRNENETLANLLEMGWNNIYECRICKINEEAHPEKQEHLVHTGTDPIVHIGITNLKTKQNYETTEDLEHDDYYGITIFICLLI